MVVLLQLGSPLATLAALDFWLALWICSFLTTSLGEGGWVKRGEIPQMHQAAATAAVVVVAAAIKTAAAAAAAVTTTTTPET